MLFRNDKRDPQSPPPSGLRVPLLPLRDIIVFPHMVSQLFVGREKSIAALDEAMAHDKEIFLAAQKSAKTNEPPRCGRARHHASAAYADGRGADQLEWTPTTKSGVRIGRAKRREQGAPTKTDRAV